MNFEFLDQFAKSLTLSKEVSVDWNVSKSAEFFCENEYFSSAVFVTSLIIIVFGLIGNTVTVLSVSCIKDLRKPTYLIIASLACADTLCLIIQRIAKSFDTVRYAIPFDVFMAISAALTGASTHHVIGLSIFRLRILKHPMRFRQHMTRKRTAKYISCCWILGVVIGTGAFGLSYMEKHKALQTAVIIFLFVLDVVVYQLILLIIHILKIVELKRSTVYQERISPHIKKLSNMMCCIILVNIISNLPMWTTFSLLTMFHEAYELTLIRCYILPISFLLLVARHSLNPVIFFFMSKPYTDIMNCCLKLASSNKAR